MPTLASRAKGAIWGVCIADALGGPVQFKKPGTFPPIAGLCHVSPFDEPAGSYSDDGSMTLALAQSFIDAHGHYDHRASVQNYLDWLNRGAFSTTDYAWDVGVSTRLALSLWDASSSSSLRTDDAQRAVDAKLDRDSRCGNGSLMRMAPVGVVLWRDASTARRVAREQGAVTHPARACVEACELYTEVMVAVMRGETKERLARIVAAFPLTHPALAERMAPYTRLEDWRDRSAQTLRSTGWVVDTLELALWAFFACDDWAAGALTVVNFGGDSDTAGAVYGGLAGAFYGMEAVPRKWVEGMQKGWLIGMIAGEMAGLVASLPDN